MVVLVEENKIHKNCFVSKFDFIQISHVKFTLEADRVRVSLLIWLNQANPQNDKYRSNVIVSTNFILPIKFTVK